MPLLRSMPSHPTTPLATAIATIISLVAVGLLSTLMISLQSVIHSSTAALLYILVVLLSGVAFGLAASLGAALLSALVFTYFFIPPYQSFDITSVENGLRLVVFVAVALLIGSLASRAQRQARIAAQRANTLNALYQFSQALEAEVELERILPLVARTTIQILRVPGCQVLLHDEHGVLVQRAAEGVTAAVVPHEEVPLYTEQRSLGVLKVARRAPDTPLTVAERELLQTVAAQASLVIERVHLTDVMGQNRALAASDQLKSTLLSLVSHDLRTPLAVIKGLVTSLLDPRVTWTDALRYELLTTINDEADRLNRIVGELLEMSRIEAGAISQARSWYDLDELIVAVAAAVQPRLQSHTLELDVPSDLPWVRISYAQIEQVLRNLLENAVYYTPPNAPIAIWARTEAHSVRVEVRDCGPGIPAAMRDQVFEKFVRVAAPERNAEGSGLGLAICKGLIEAHGGQIWVEEHAGGGSIFVFTLPVEPMPAPTPMLALH